VVLKHLWLYGVVHACVNLLLRNLQIDVLLISLSVSLIIDLLIDRLIYLLWISLLVARLVSLFMDCLM